MMKAIERIDFRFFTKKLCRALLALLWGVSKQAHLEMQEAGVWTEGGALEPPPYSKWTLLLRPALPAPRVIDFESEPVDRGSKLKIAGEGRWCHLIWGSF